MPRTIRKKSSPIQNIEDRPKLQARRRKKTTENESSKSEITTSRRSARRSIVESLGDDEPQKRVTRQSTQLANTPSSNVSGVYEIDSKSPKTPVNSVQSPKNLTYSKSPILNVTYSPKSPVFTPQSRRVTSTPFVKTPRSIIKNKENDPVSHITLRKRRSDPEPMVITKKSRVTFNPNASIFKCETQDQELLNDLYEYPEGIEIPKTPKRIATPGKLLTFTPEELPKSSRKSYLTPVLSKLVLTSKKTSEFRARKTPNFASIHKRNAEKMESLIDNHERKAARAKLFDWKGPVGNQTLPEIGQKVVATGPHIGRKSMTRFGFHRRAVQDRKNEFKEVVLKSKVVGAKRQELNREYVKGVRSNRRFDLLMQSREIKF